ncbi:PilW family protein [Pseudomonas sp. 2FG]|uniref:PilW family protein n=1 Tax=Pseudomonas sp. 2FG TaxID=2502191 RepID=UPI0010F6CC81|nr:PilW family protein [Pseudomonas sp. 2FG]
MKHRQTPLQTTQQGLSLIELMVAILLSSLLLLGVLQMFSNTSASDKANTALARLQESGRVALEILKQDLRRTGYIGCASPTPLEPEDLYPEGHTPTRNFPADAIGVQDIDTDEGPGTASDKLTVVHGSAVPAELKDISGSTAILVTRDANLRIGNGVGQEFVLTDCEKVYVFSATVSASSANDVSSKPIKRDKLGFQYRLTQIKDKNGAPLNAVGDFRVEGAQIVRLGQVTYDVSNGALRKNGAELIANVDNFQVLYGINDAGQTRWVNADGLDDDLRGQISQVQISLVIASPENAASGISNQVFNIANIGANTQLAAANNQRLRRVFNTTIDMRNRSID